MKKSIVFLLVFVLSGLIFAESPKKTVDRLYKELVEKSISSEAVEYRHLGYDFYDFDIQNVNASDIEADLDTLDYILKTTYAGYKDALNKGLDMNMVCVNLLEKIKGKPLVSVTDFRELLVSEFEGKIRDHHFCFYQYDGAISWMCGDALLCLSDLYVEKKVRNIS